MRKLNLIAAQVFRKNLRSISWWLLVLMPLIGIAVIGGIAWYMTSTSAPAKVLVVGPKAVQTGLRQQNNGSITYVPAVSRKAAVGRLADAKADAMLEVPALPAKSAKLLARNDGQNVSQTQVQTALGSLNTAAVAQSMGLSQAQLTKLLTAPNLSHQSVSFDDQGRAHTAKGKSDSLKSLIATAVGLVMYLFLLSYGSIISQEIATEKGSRIEESILTAMRPGTQFYGKLLGVSELLLVQLGVYAVIGLGAIGLKAHIPMLNKLLAGFDWSQIGWAFTLLTVAYFIVGILCYTILAALCGSLVSNQEQAGQALQPVVLLSMVGYFTSLMVANAHGVLISILSYLPFLSPMIMPARFGVGQVGVPQALIALAISIVFLAVFAWLSAKAYGANVLVYNDSGLWKSIKKSIAMAKAR